MKPINRARLRIPSYFASRELHTNRRNLLTLFQVSREKLEQSLIGRWFEPPQTEFALEMREAFGGRCAFCEDEGNGAPMRFRPDSEAEPIKEGATSHLYYSWLSTSWDNWYWICNFCRPENERYFPLQNPRGALPDLQQIILFCDPPAAGREPYSRTPGYRAKLPASWSMLPGIDSRRAERPLLLDPCLDQISSHFAVGPGGELVALTRRGRVTIDHYHLARKPLTRARRHAIENFHRDLLEERRLLPAAYLDQLRFPGIIRLRIRTMAGFLARELGVRAPGAWRSIEATFAQAASDPRAVELLEAATRFDPRTRMAQIAGTVAVAAAGAVLATETKTQPPLASLPRLVKFSLQNFKSLENLSFQIPERDRRRGAGESNASAGALLILGENATGKSSILEGAALCLSEKVVRDAAAPEPQELVLDPRYMDATLADESREAKLRAVFSDRSITEIRIRDGQFHLRGGKKQHPVFAYGAFRQYQKAEPITLRADHQIATLFRGGELLPNPTPWLLTLDPDRFRMVARSLGVIFAMDGEFEMIRRDKKVCYVVNDYMHRGFKRTEQTPLDSVSSGFRAILAMTCDIMRGLMEGKHAANFQSFLSARAIVFIDEIEAHLHPRWKLSIMSSLRDALPNVTFIVTSHDPLCLRGMASEEVIVLNRVRGIESDETQLPIHIETLDDLPDIEELTVEQLLTADFFQLNSTASRETDREYAMIADMLKAQAEAPTPTDPAELVMKNKALRSFIHQVNEALPVGDSEVQRLVQGAVAEYLRVRSNKTAAGLKALRAETRQRIINALGSI